MILFLLTCLSPGSPSQGTLTASLPRESDNQVYSMLELVFRILSYLCFSIIKLTLGLLQNYVKIKDVYNDHP